MCQVNAPFTNMCEPDVNLKMFEDNFRHTVKMVKGCPFIVLVDTHSSPETFHFVNLIPKNLVSIGGCLYGKPIRYNFMLRLSL